MPKPDKSFREIAGKEFLQLADALSDTPQTVIAVHCLRWGMCRAFVAGPINNFEAAIVQYHDLPDEPAGFSNDPNTLWELLKMVSRWFCVNVNQRVAPLLAELIQEKLHNDVRLYKDSGFILTEPAVVYTHKDVRLLTIKDIQLLEKAPKELRGSNFGGIKNLLVESIAAGAVIENRLVCLAYVNALTEKYADIGVITLENYRQQGLATTASSLVTQEIQKRGRLPIWSNGEDNLASSKIARKLGFVENYLSFYIIVE